MNTELLIPLANFRRDAAAGRDRSPEFFRALNLLVRQLRAAREQLEPARRQLESARQQPEILAKR